MTDTTDEQQLRIGVVGAGYIGTYVGSQFHAHRSTAIAAVTDIDESTRDETADAFGVPAESRYADYERMLADERLDAVLIGTPHTLHYEQCVAALERDLDVLVDKPMTTDLEHARDLRDRVADSERVLMVGYQRHLNSSFRSARERWQEGDRDPSWITAEVCQDWIDRFEGTWRRDPDLSGGGYLYDTGSHLLDAVLWTTGLTPAAVSANMDFVDDEERVDERADLTIRFENGATASVSTYGAAPCVREHIHAWDDDGAVYLEGREWDPREVVEIDDDSGERDPYIDHSTSPNKADAFVDAVLGDEEPPATAEDGLRVTAVTEAAYESARSGGEWVAIDLGEE